MRQEDAKVQIIQEWRIWLQAHGSEKASTNMLLFHSWLKKNRPDLFAFRCAGDQWQTLKGWLS